MTGGKNSAVVRAVADHFQSHTGQHLSESRLWRIEPALQTVMRQHGLSKLNDLVDLLHSDPDGRVSASILHCITNHESSFFRDLNVFEMLETQVLPHLHRTSAEKVLRIWCAGCSTGQEAYSIAIILKRQEQLWQDWRVSIIGTDVSPFAIEKAQAGVYPQMDIQRGLPVGYLLDWFEPVEDAWRVSRDIRSMVAFKADNLLSPRAVTGIFDLVLCRNVMFYFTPASRTLALSCIARHVRRDSILLLGAGETTIGTTNLFAPSSEFRGAYKPSGLPAMQAVPGRLAG